MNSLQLFLPCAAGVEDYLLAEAQRVTGLDAGRLHKRRSGVLVQGSWRDALLLNLHSRLAQRVLVQLAHAPYRAEQDLYNLASEVAWEAWFTPRQTLKVEITAQHSPLKSLNFAALKIKDAVCDRFRHKQGLRPDVDTRWPDVRLYAHLSQDLLTIYIDTSGEPLFKRGWREDKGDAPLKETLAAAMLAACGWSGSDSSPILYDPCCGSGTIAIEAAQMACGMAPGLQRRFGFENLLPFQAAVWQGLKVAAQEVVRKPVRPVVFGSDVSHRMVDFAQRNAQRAGVADLIEFRGGDALQRMPPASQPGILLLNPPYGERIAAAGVAGAGELRTAGDQPGIQPRFGARELPEVADGGEFFSRLASHWKKHYPGWTAWVLTPDLKLPGKLRFQASRRVPLWNGPIECRLFRFDLVAGSRRPDAPGPAHTV